MRPRIRSTKFKLRRLWDDVLIRNPQTLCNSERVTAGARASSPLIVTLLSRNARSRVPFHIVALFPITANAKIPTATTVSTVSVVLLSPAALRRPDVRTTLPSMIM